MVRDFLEPLEKMPPLREVPASGRLPFAPRGMSLAPISEGLVVGGGPIGFGLYDEAIQQIRHLDWIVETRLSKVNRKGDVIARLGVRRKTLRSVEGNSIEGLERRVSGEPAFYRFDISFRKLAGNERLGKYSLYARVMKPRQDIRLVAQQESVVPGEFARASLINMGTVRIESASYDYGVAVQRFTGERWVLVRDNPPRGPSAKLMQILPAGAEIRGCLRYQVPVDQGPGLFRFALPGPQGKVATAEFEVAAVPAS